METPFDSCGAHARISHTATGVAIATLIIHNMPYILQATNVGVETREWG